MAALPIADITVTYTSLSAACTFASSAAYCSVSSAVLERRDSTGGSCMDVSIAPVLTSIKLAYPSVDTPISRYSRRVTAHNTSAVTPKSRDERRL